jgi:hypothetical protein
MEDLGVRRRGDFAPCPRPTGAGKLSFHKPRLTMNHQAKFKTKKSSLEASFGDALTTDLSVVQR